MEYLFIKTQDCIEVVHFLTLKYILKTTRKILYPVWGFLLPKEKRYISIFDLTSSFQISRFDTQKATIQIHNVCSGSLDPFYIVFLV